MLSKEVVELSKQHSVIRDIFEYGMKRAKEVGGGRNYNGPKVAKFLVG